MMTPGIRHGQTPPFHELGADVFQELCRDLFDAEPNVANCEIYGTRGQSQYGVDLLAHRKDGHGIEVGQCKCYRDFRPGKIREASDEFLKYWDYWSTKNVRRFVLFVACDLTARQKQEEILRQTERFRALDLDYEVWSAAKLRNKLRPHRAIVANYCTPAEHWLRVICGETTVYSPVLTSSSQPTSVIVETALLNQLRELTDRVSGAVENRIEEMLSAWREGRKQDTIRQVSDLTNDKALWNSLSAHVRSRALRLQASLELDSGNIEQSKELADQADPLEAPYNNRLRSVIAYREGGPEQGLEVLSEPKEVEDANLRAAYLLEMRRLDEAKAALDFVDESFKPNAETYRLRSLLHLAGREIDQARLNIQKALELEPKWEKIQLVAGVIGYYESLSPVVIPDRIMQFPTPVDWTLVKTDDESRASLESAIQLLEGLAQQDGRTQDELDVLETWLMACMANHPEKQLQAISYCKKLLDRSPAHYPAIAWACARNFELDLDSSTQALRELQEEPREIPNILASVAVLADAGDNSERRGSTGEYEECVPKLRRADGMVSVEDEITRQRRRTGGSIGTFEGR